MVSNFFFFLFFLVWFQLQSGLQPKPSVAYTQGRLINVRARITASQKLSKSH
jgi:hypothetical protein